jgi:hypothetical protein
MASGVVTPQPQMSEAEYQHEVRGEVIKMIHDELPAVRWTCGGCGEDTATIFFDPDIVEKMIVCDSCGATNLVHADKTSSN